MYFTITTCTFVILYTIVKIREVIKENVMNTYTLTTKQQQELVKANMNDLIRAMLGTLRSK